jgi:hypothetical protein
MGQAAGHRQVADRMRQRVDAAGRYGSCPNEGGVSCKTCDRFATKEQGEATTWRSDCRTLVE